MNTLFNFIYTKKVVISFFSFLLFANSSIANTSIDVGPALGEKAPAITVITTQQQSVNIKELSQNKGLIILFFRSADWCPFCKKHLIELNDTAEKFTALGYGLAAISYDDTDVLATFSQQQKITYPLLSDQKAQTMLAYNIVNNQYAVGDEHYGIPYPGVVVIDENGKVIHKHFFEGYKKRVKFNDLYQQLSE